MEQKNIRIVCSSDKLIAHYWHCIVQNVNFKKITDAKLHGDFSYIESDNAKITFRLLSPIDNIYLNDRYFISYDLRKSKLENSRFIKDYREILKFL